MIEGLDVAKLSANDLGDAAYVLVQVARPTTLQVDAAVEAINELVDHAEAVEELRLTLAAEQGRQEGASSSGWVYSPMLGCWHKRVSSRSSYGVGRNRDGSAWWSLDAMQPSGNAPTMRAAMKAADEAEAALSTAQES